MVYIYSNDNVIGISLTICKYCNVKKEKIIKLISSNGKNIISFNDYFLDSKLKKIINNKKYVIPYFMKIYEIKK